MGRELHAISTDEYCHRLWDGIYLYSFLTYVKNNTKIKISPFSKYRSVIVLPIIFALILTFIGGQETLIAPIIGISILCLVPLIIYHVEYNREKRISNGYVFVMDRNIGFLREFILSILPYADEDCSEFKIEKNYTVDGLVFQKEDHACRITLFSRENNKTLVHFSICNDERVKYLNQFNDAIADLVS